MPSPHVVLHSDELQADHSPGHSTTSDLAAAGTAKAARAPAEKRAVVLNKFMLAIDVVVFVVGFTVWCGVGFVLFGWFVG